jgi:hypothetical protein
MGLHKLVCRDLEELRISLEATKKNTAEHNGLRDKAQPDGVHDFTLAVTTVAVED